MEPTIYKPSIYKGAGIYKVGAEGGAGGEPGVIIPPNYEQYKYLQFKNGNDFIRISAAFTGDYIYDVIFCDDLDYDGGSEKIVFYSSYSGDISISCINDKFSPSFRIYGNNGGNVTKRIFVDFTKIRNDFFNVVLNKNKTFVNGNPGEQDVVYNARNYTYLMLGYSDARFCLTGKIGRLIVKNGTEKKYYFVPAFGINENKPGMYDFINDIFYPVYNNNGSIICTD